jgi:sugar phosphate isomerase/epimerase
MYNSITRRKFMKLSAGTAALIAINPAEAITNQKKEQSMVRLGGPLFTKYNNPGEWINALQELEYKAAYCPLDTSAGVDEIKAYKKAANDADIIIAEVGVWNNTISPDEKERQEAIQKCIKSLQLADEIGANCCVNISGSRNEKYWAGPHKDNLTDDTFHLIVETTRKIIDAVKPANTWFTLEPMPWSFPYSPDSYLRLINAIDRKGFSVHLDPVNMITSPEIYFRNGAMIRECFTKLGPYIKSCHAKDILLKEDIYIPQFEETRPGLGILDYTVFLKELSKLNNVPLMMEHLQTAEEYRQSAEYIRSVGRQEGIMI